MQKDTKREVTAFAIEHKNRKYIVYYANKDNSVHWVVETRMSWYLENRKAHPEQVVLGNENDCEDKVQEYLHYGTTDVSYLNPTPVRHTGRAYQDKRTKKEPQPTRYDVLRAQNIIKDCNLPTAFVALYAMCEKGEHTEYCNALQKVFPELYNGYVQRIEEMEGALNA